MRVYPLLYIVVFLLHSFTFCCITLKMMDLEVKARERKFLHLKFIQTLDRGDASTIGVKGFLDLPSPVYC